MLRTCTSTLRKRSRFASYFYGDLIEKLASIGIGKKIKGWTCINEVNWRVERSKKRRNENNNWNLMQKFRKIKIVEWKSEHIIVRKRKNYRF